MHDSPPLSSDVFLKKYGRLLYLIQEKYKQVHPPGSKNIEHDFEFVQRQRTVYKDAWKLLQAKHIFPVLRVIGFSGGINFNAIKKTLPEINSQTLTNRLKQLQDLHLVERKVIATQPLAVTYTLTEFGSDYCSLMFPIFFLFNMKQIWKPICENYSRDPPAMPPVDEIQFSVFITNLGDYPTIPPW